MSELDAIVGVLTMEHWEIKLDPKTGALDLEGLRRREFAEYEGLGLGIRVLEKLFTNPEPPIQNPDYPFNTSRAMIIR